MRFQHYTLPILLTGLFLYIFSSGCISSKTSLKNVAVEKSLLWEIQTPGAKEPSYLFGTIHIIGAEDYFLPKGTMTSFEKSNKIFFEIDMAQMLSLIHILLGS